jgi:hypothetical protein
MERKLTLSKNAFLWEEGDNAHNIAILEKGRLGVKVGNRIVGVLTPKMVLGEAAISTLDGKSPKRTATLVALDNDTYIVEFPATLVKNTFDNGNDAVSQLVLNTLAAQVCRNALLVMHSYKNQPLLSLPLKSLMQGIIQAKDHLKVGTWEEFMLTFRFLSDIRDFSEEMRRNYVIMTSDKSELIERASATIREMISDKDLAPILETFMKAEQEKADWFEPLSGS